MTLAALTWPEAVVWATSIAAIGLVLAVLIWSSFRTGQSAIRQDAVERKAVERLRSEIDELRAQLERRTPAA